jgi:hypothetical protein
MAEFPRDARKQKVLAALCELGFDVVREAEHIALRRSNPDGTVTPMTIPNHSTYRASTLRTVLRKAGIPREDFLEAYDS